MKKFHTITDIERLISDVPLCAPELYKDCYIEGVAGDLLDLWRKRGFKWGDEAPEYTEEEFWRLFEAYEI